MLQSRPMRRLIRQTLSAPAQPLRLWKAWLALLPCLLLIACSATAPLTSIGEGPLGTVALERLASRGTTVDPRVRLSAGLEMLELVVTTLREHAPATLGVLQPLLERIAKAWEATCQG